MESTVKALRRSTMAIAAPLVLFGATAQAGVAISSGKTANMNCSGGVCTATAKNAILNVSDLETMLAGGNVDVQSGEISKDITVAAKLTWATTSALTLDAYDSIAVDAPVSVTGMGGVTLTTDDGGSTGTLGFYKSGNMTFANLSSNLTVDGAAYVLVGDIKTLANDITANQTGNYALAKSYNAKRDGTYGSAPIASEFDGTFEGLGNTISNLTIVDGTQSGAADALFSSFASGTIRDVGIVNASMTSTGDQGANGVGLLVGSMYEATIWRCYATGTASVGRYAGAGGLVSGGEGTISQSWADVAITGSYAVGLGGLVSDFYGTISQSYATGSVTDPGTSDDFDSLGALVGTFSSGTISQSYATGAVSFANTGAMYDNIGGLVGLNAGSSTISQSYFAGTISALTLNCPNDNNDSGLCVGGLLGFDVPGDTNTSDYWDTTTSGIVNLSQGAGDIPNDPGIAGLTTNKLQSRLPKGFSKKVWGENASINNGLPYLISNPPSK